MEKKISSTAHNDIDLLLRHLEKEGQMLDDHGQTIIGKRDRPPHHEEQIERK
jgi:hypothetical protein